jgi:hypothetical protein
MNRPPRDDATLATLIEGDAVGLMTDTGQYIPFRFESVDAKGNIYLAPIIPHQPRSCVTLGYGDEPGQIKRASDVTFTQTCALCNGPGIRKVLIPGTQNYEWHSCYNCGNRGFVPWEPFEPGATDGLTGALYIDIKH